MCCRPPSPCGWLVAWQRSRTLGFVGWQQGFLGWKVGFLGWEPSRTLIVPQAACSFLGPSGAEPSQYPLSRTGLWPHWCYMVPVSKIVLIICPVPCPCRAGRGGLRALHPRGPRTPLALRARLPRGFLPCRQPRAAQQSLQEVQYHPTRSQSKAGTDGECWQQ